MEYCKNNPPQHDDDVISMNIIPKKKGRGRKK
jgi:hypothetical protein